MFIFGTINIYGVYITKCEPNNCYDPGVTGRMACNSDSSFCFIEGSHIKHNDFHDVKKTKKDHVHRNDLGIKVWGEIYLKLG